MAGTTPQEQARRVPRKEALAPPPQHMSLNAASVLFRKMLGFKKVVRVSFLPAPAFQGRQGQHSSTYSELH